MSTASAAPLSSSCSRVVTVALAVTTVIAMSPCAAWAGGPRIVSDGETAPAAVPPAAVAPTATPAPVLAQEVPREVDLRAFELGLSGVMLYSGDDYIVGEAVYGGLSWFLRWRMEQWWSLTLGLDLVSRGSDPEAVGELRVGGDLGGQIYFLEDPIWQPFVALGVAMASTSVFDHRGAAGAETTSDELGGYAGLGLDLLLDEWMFTTQLRALCMSRLDAEAPPPRDDYLRRAADVRGLLHWSVGAGYRF